MTTATALRIDNHPAARVVLHTNPATMLPYRHGTAFTYEKGCRCNPCHAAREVEERWLPIEPVADALEARGWSLHEAEQNFQVNLRKSDRLTTNQADIIACRLGCHPSEIWGLDLWGSDRVPDEELGQLRLPFFAAFESVPPLKRCRARVSCRTVCSEQIPLLLAA